MTRVPHLSEADVSDRNRPYFDSQKNVSRALANSGDGLRHVMRVGGWIRVGLSLDPRLRQLAIIQVAYVTGCRYMFSHHVAIGFAEGCLTEDDIQLVVAPNRKSADAKTAAVLAAAEELTAACRLSDSTWDALQKSMDARTLTELVMVIANYNQSARVLEGLQVSLEEGHGYEEILQKWFDPEAAQ